MSGDRNISVQVEWSKMLSINIIGNMDGRLSSDWISGSGGILDWILDMRS